MAWESKGRGRPWRRKRQTALERDEYLCQPCKRLGKVTQATEVDHIIGVAEGGKDEDDNL
jgi:5-methylcytosine-specific restriction protein A